jgi:hypothetical protein
MSENDFFSLEHLYHMSVGVGYLVIWGFMCLPGTVYAEVGVIWIYLNFSMTMKNLDRGYRQSRANFFVVVLTLDRVTDSLAKPRLLHAAPAAVNHHLNLPDTITAE